MLLSIRDLSVQYSSIPALQGVSFEVKKGEIVSLIGANGAGKTTSLRAISGLIGTKAGSSGGRITNGTITFNNTDIAGLPAHHIVLKGLLHCPEGRGIFSNMSVLENLQLGAYFRDDHEDIQRDLQHCYQLFPRLKERLAQRAGTLSGGEQQMLAISRALMGRPQLLMLDEPSLGLAPRIVAQIFEIIQMINREGTTVLLVEQNARLALKISHRAYVLETGRVLFEGEGKALLNDQRVIDSYLGGGAT